MIEDQDQEFKGTYKLIGYDSFKKALQTVAIEEHNQELTNLK